MKRGPKPKPALKELKQGKPGKRGVRTTRKVAPSDASIPDWLDAAGREIWSLQMPGLLTLGFFLDSDKPAFARYCDHVARWIVLRKSVEKKGETYETRSKHGRMLRINPQFQAMLMLEEKIGKLEDRFGLTPAQREALQARMNDPPAARKLPTALPDPAAPGSGASAPIPSTPLGRLSPEMFRRPSGSGGTH